MNVELLSITENIEKVIEKAGRNCYQSEEKITNESCGPFIRGIVKSGHHSVLEHGYATFKIENVSRALMAQLTRHRLSSFSIKSQRYVDESDFDFIIPDSIGDHEDALFDYLSCMKIIEETYQKLREYGIKKEDARMVLPNSATTDIVMSANMRQWRNILKLRLEKSAQWEIRDMAEDILAILSEHAPNVFYDFK